MSKILQKVKAAFVNYPFSTNAVVYGTLYVGAELSQQILCRKILNKGEESEALDFHSIKRYAFYGTFIQGPLLINWYTLLDKKYVGTATTIITKKLFLDQFFMTPQLLCIFYVGMSIMERKEDIFEECKRKFLPTFERSCYFWIPAQIINFVLLPPHYRVAYVGTCSFAWINILCYLKRQQL